MMFAIIFLGISLHPLPQETPAVSAHNFQARQTGREDADYQKGLSDLDGGHWRDAVDDFDASAERRGANADAALYWKAYAQNREGEREEALDTITQFKRQYSSSRWMKDAKALEVEVRAASGAPVNAGAYGDEDLKLLALNGLMNSEPGQALPILKHLLESNNSPQIKDRALFVLVQNPSPEGRKLLVDVARNGANPDMQVKAIHYMGMMGSDASRNELAALYNSSSDRRLKRAILEAFMMSGSRDFLLNAAKTEKDPELWHHAIQQLAASGGEAQLWQLYQSETSVENKEAILKTLFMTGNSAHLAEVAQSEHNPELRIAAIKSLGLMGDRGQGDLLVSIYRSDQNQEVRKAVVRALFIQQNAKALVDLARREKDPEMRKEIVSQLALIHSKESTDYMLELLR